MNRIPSILCLPLVLFAAVGAAAVRGATPTPLAEVVAAERAFAARAQEVDAREAFAEHFATDARFFGPDPGPAFPALAEGPPWGIDIRWRPADAGVARSGDFGWTTGPAEYRRSKADAPHRWGWYTSVWARQPDGRWKVAIDGGVTVPMPTTAIPDLAEAPASDRPADPWRPRRWGPSPEQRAEALLAADRALAERASRNAAEAFDAVLSRDARVHRDGVAPAVGRNAALGALRDGAATYAWAPIGARVAASGELGYTHGSGEKRTTTGPRPFHYLAIWERHDGRWTLRVLVHTTPASPG